RPWRNRLSRCLNNQYISFISPLFYNLYMEGKARENIEAAKILQEQRFCDSSASRAYYGAYLAAWHHLSKLGILPDSSYWRHDTFPEVLLDEYKLIGPLQKEQFEL